ncbi:Fic family protein [Coraliomargarita algicola]|uniref:Fic family protein n=1 Tax=Coraliomargarita algicola TaxID=3092156 RepID=A0ABZ0RQ10_9BACT|nr:Fic family protein [Coraliomargarita sp. J2-16]WPJ97516.1 Fic family protein [Coraliomargarita sp. J2-16]
MEYHWQLPDWPEFRYELGELEASLLDFVDRAGLVSGSVQALPESEQNNAIADLMIVEALKTSEIEGAVLSRPDVASSIRNGLGLNYPHQPVRDRASAGAAELMLAVRSDWAADLSGSVLLDWHRVLMQGANNMAIGQWRSHVEPMQVVELTLGEPRVLYEAPPSDLVPAEIKGFVEWFNTSRDQIRHAPIRAGLAHLYFESIHPFEDGNGRVGRAVAEKALFQGAGRPLLMSLSQAIEADKTSYYTALQRAQRSNEVTDWLRYFVDLLLRALDESQARIDFVLKKARFFDRYREALSERQLKVVRRMLDAGPAGFEGGVNASKYQRLTGVSKPTATRDLQELLQQGVLTSIGGGRSTRYEVNL